MKSSVDFRGLGRRVWAATRLTGSHVSRADKVDRHDCQHLYCRNIYTWIVSNRIYTMMMMHQQIDKYASPVCPTELLLPPTNSMHCPKASETAKTGIPGEAMHVYLDSTSAQVDVVPAGVRRPPGRLQLHGGFAHVPEKLASLSPAPCCLHCDCCPCGPQLQAGAPGSPVLLQGLVGTYIREAQGAFGMCGNNGFWENIHKGRSLQALENRTLSTGS